MRCENWLLHPGVCCLSVVLLCQAVEAKEALDIQAESITLASVSYQAFFRCNTTLHASFAGIMLCSTTELRLEHATQMLHVSRQQYMALYHDDSARLCCRRAQAAACVTVPVVESWRAGISPSLLV